MATHFAGVMSGTSLDGADAAIVRFDDGPPRTLSFSSVPFPESLRARLLALSAPGSDSLDDAAEATRSLADHYARAVREALREAGLEPAQVAAIGCHGQTVRHRPERGFTVQLNDPARLVELTGIEVVADFRRRDVAAGGQGAPLAPLFHAAVFSAPGEVRAIVNIGGIANITRLAAGEPLAGFDCGPGNVLLDAWARRHLGTPYDAEGAFAARGRVDESLIRDLLSEPYLAKAPPKSTGRELFHEAWLLPRIPALAKPEDVQATLVEYTARTIIEAVDRFSPGVDAIYLCGGGARNALLVGRIATLAHPRRVADTGILGFPSGQVEAAAFAWLAMKCVRREPLDLEALTGARGPRVLGAIYPA